VTLLMGVGCVLVLLWIVMGYEPEGIPLASGLH
jgi:hypothetical protein